MDRSYVGIVVKTFKQKGGYYIYLLTERDGVKSFKINGINGKNRIYKPYTDPLNRLEITLGDRGNFIEAELIDRNEELRKSYKNSEFLLTQLKTFSQYLKYMDQSYCFYNLLLRMIDGVKSIPNPPYNKLQLLFYYYFTYCLGVGFELDDNPNPNSSYYRISLEDGSITTSERGYPLSNQSFKILRELSRSKFSNPGNEIRDFEMDKIISFIKKYLYNHFNNEVIE